MNEDLIPILTRFHREVVLPDIQRVVNDLRQEMTERFSEMDAHIDAVYQRFNRLEAEHNRSVGLGDELSRGAPEDRSALSVSLHPPTR